MFPPEDIEKISEITSSFKGNAVSLERAIGCYYLCFLFGWKVMKLIHGKRSWKKHQALLDINFEADYVPETTELSHKNLAYKLWKSKGDFWKVIEGKYKIDNGRKSDIVDY